MHNHLSIGVRRAGIWKYRNTNAKEKVAGQGENMACRIKHLHGLNRV